MTTRKSFLSSDEHLPYLGVAGFFALVAPTLIAAHTAPSVTFYNQALAVLGWGLFVAALSALTSPVGISKKGWAAGSLAAVLAISATEAFGSAFIWGDLAGGLGLMGGFMSLAGMLVLWSGWRSGLSRERESVLTVFFGALTLSGVLGMVLALIQAFHPAWADGMFIAESTMVGRAVGNLRQPNHFSTLLVWACCGAAWLGASKRLPEWLSAGLIALFIGGVVLTASRTGMVGMVFLSLWGLLDKSLPRKLRATLIGALAIYGLFWGGMWLWSHSDKTVAFAANARLHDHSDISSSRFKIWANVLELIRQNPWSGVGYGEFNVAWTLTPFPTRPVAFFDHTHNLPLQWAVEFGVPLALLLSALSLAAFWGLMASAKACSGGAKSMTMTVGACSVIVAIAAFHSLVEYPLWYSYFLLPTMFAWGMGLSASSSTPLDAPASPTRTEHAGHKQPVFLVAGLLMAAMSVWCAVDYQAAANIYAPRKGAGPLEQRISFGKKMPWWGHQADYADVTVGDDEDPSQAPAAFKRTLHNLMDARLMVSYAKSLAEHGEVDKARYVVQRLKEFRNPIGDTFMAACKTPPAAGEALPFQCDLPKQSYTWRQVLPH